MLDVYIPDFAFAEMQYMLDYMLVENLGLKVNYIPTNVNDIEIRSQHASLEIKNYFFDRKLDWDDHFQMQNIPNSVKDSTIEIGNINYSLATIYGKNTYQEDNQTIVLHADIISSGFFLLTRWEETISEAKDLHQRFDSSTSLTRRHNLHQRPLVDEYIVVLSALIRKLGVTAPFKKHNYQILPSHDIDKYRFLNSNTHKATKWVKAKLTGQDNVIQSLQADKDIFDKMDFFTEMADKLDTKAYFFFLMGNHHKNDMTNKESDIIHDVQTVAKSDHYIGIHPSYTTLEHPERIKEETLKLATIAGKNITKSRFHYLRIHLPQSYNQIEQTGLIEDYTLGYADNIGFRSGVCRSYPFFDCKKRKQLQLRAQPLMVMDVSLKDYMGLAPQDAIQQIQSIQQITKKYNGEFSFLWHNSSFVVDGWEKYETVLQELYK